MVENLVLTLQVVPRSSRDAITGWQGEALKVKVTAAPEDGRANAAVVALLAKELNVPKAAITLESGHASRNKRLRITGLSQAALSARLAGAKPQRP